MESYQEQAVAYLKGEMGSAEQAAFEESLARSEELRAELSRSRELLELLEAASEKSIADQVQRQIQAAVSGGASALHMVPEAGEVRVSCRVDGTLHEVERYPLDRHAAVLDRWKLLASASVLEKMQPQDGRIVVPHAGRELDLRIHFLPTFHGERITARILDRAAVLIGLDRLGFSPHHLEAVQRLASLPCGLVICTGPAGSGKGTVLYSMLQAMDAGARSLMTVEDPVEFVLPGVSQVEIRRRAGFGYAEALQSVLRSDPDVVMVGELRDRETAEMALEAAMVGHLVPTTLDALSAPTAVERLREFGIGPYRIARSLAGVIGQRLVRRICAACAEEYRPSAEVLADLGLPPDDPGPFRRGRGCETCRGTGYRGRLALYELLEVDDEIRSLLARTSDPHVLWEQMFGKRGGSLWDDALRKVRAGLTTAEMVAGALADYPHPRPAAPAA